MTDQDALIRRLHALGATPVDEAVAGSHLAAMGSAAHSAPAPRARGRMVVAGAVVTGSLLATGTMAGAVTGALPSVAQDMAHTVMAKVGVEVPKSKAAVAKDRSKGQAKGNSAEAKAGTADDGAGAAAHGTERVTEECTNPDGTPFTGTHGDYVNAHPDDPATPDVNEREVAAQSQCGKPLQAADPGSPGKPADAGRPADAGKPADDERTPGTTGKPADAGKPADTGKSSERKPTTTTSSTTTTLVD